MSKTTLPPHGKQLYPWNKWANGKVHTARKGQHFVCSIESLRRALFMHANRNGLKVTTRVKGDSVTFQFSEQKKETK